MGNRNYRRGRAREYRLRKYYEKLGWVVLRTAGSHGFADLIAIKEEEKKIIFIQVKPKSMSESQRQTIEKLHSKLNESFRCSFLVLS